MVPIVTSGFEKPNRRRAAALAEANTGEQLKIMQKKIARTHWRQQAVMWIPLSGLLCVQMLTDSVALAYVNLVAFFPIALVSVRLAILAMYEKQDIELAKEIRARETGEPLLAPHE